MPQGHEHDVEVEELLIRSADGDQEAFAGVYDALVGPVLGLTCRILLVRPGRCLGTRPGQDDHG